jgi:hypothetical protein
LSQNWALTPIHAALAEKERRLISQRTREALQAAKAKGAQLGSTTAKSIANREEAQQRAEALRPIFAGSAGMSHRKMAAELNALGVPTPAGGQWHAVTVKRVLERLGCSILHPEPAAREPGSERIN